MENDLSPKGKLLADWRPWPPVIFVGVLVLTLLFQVPLIAAIVGAIIGTIIMAVAGYFGERTVAAKIAVKDSELVWIDRASRTHHVLLSYIQDIRKIPKQAESVIYYVTEGGKRQGLGVGPQVAQVVDRALNERWKLVD